MADAITRTNLKIAVARKMGISRTEGDWATDDAQAVNDIIKSGERDFYFPPITPGSKSSHAWSFMRPIMTIDLVTDISEYDMPEDFGGFVENELTYVDDNDLWSSVLITSVAEILRMRSSNEMFDTGHPRLAAETWLPSSGQVAQRKALMLWPTPDTTLSLRAQYYCLPFAIGDSTIYPLGGQPHAATLRASVLAATELEMDGVQGPYYAKFMERLATSVSIDKQLGPKFLGSMNGPDRYSTTRHRHQYVTYNGDSYPGD